jgi:hypothetical protein
MTDARLEATFFASKILQLEQHIRSRQPVLDEVEKLVEAYRNSFDQLKISVAFMHDDVEKRFQNFIEAEANLSEYVYDNV